MRYIYITIRIFFIVVETALSKGKAAITAANQTNVDDSKTTEAEAALNAITSR